MTIRFYPSRLPGEPLETHEHGVTSIRNWLVTNVEEYEDREVSPLAIELDGQLVPPGEWAFRIIRPESDVRIYPVPFATGFAIASLVIAVAAAAYSIYMMNNMDSGGYTSSTGRSLDLNPAKANSAKLGDAIREVFGRRRIYPDYVVQPVTRYDPADPTIMHVHMLVCLGRVILITQRVISESGIHQKRLCRDSVIQTIHPEPMFPAMSVAKIGSIRLRLGEHPLAPGLIWRRPHQIQTTLSRTA